MSENLRGYGLLSPTLILLALAAPILVLAGLSPWTRTETGYDTTPTLDNYVTFFEKRLYPFILWRSLKRRSRPWSPWPTPGRPSPSCPSILSLSKIHRSLIEAARDLGEGPVMTLIKLG